MSGTSSEIESSQIRRSGSSEELQQVMDLRKRKRMESNRESARRSRLRKQEHLDHMTAQMAQLKDDNRQIQTSVDATTRLYLSVEAENSVLRAQMAELANRLNSLEEIVRCLNPQSCEMSEKMLCDHYGGFVVMNEVDYHHHHQNPWEAMHLNQPTMDMFMC